MGLLVLKPSAKVAIRSTHAAIAFKQLGVAHAYWSPGPRICLCMLKFRCLSQAACGRWPRNEEQGLLKRSIGSSRHLVGSRAVAYGSVGYPSSSQDRVPLLTSIKKLAALPWLNTQTPC
jgi:hypothetical protein